MPVYSNRRKKIYLHAKDIVHAKSSKNVKLRDVNVKFQQQVGLYIPHSYLIMYFCLRQISLINVFKIYKIHTLFQLPFKKLGNPEKGQLRSCLLKSH